MKSNETTLIEIAIFNHFNYRANIIVPNVSWGFFSYREVDIMVIRKSGYCVEIEINTSGADIKADLKKWHKHKSKYFKELWFAVPDRLKSHPDIPVQAGILAINPINGRIEIVRKPVSNKDAIALTPEQRLKIAHLGCMRIYGLTKKVRALNVEVLK